MGQLLQRLPAPKQIGGGLLWLQAKNPLGTREHGVALPAIGAQMPLWYDLFGKGNALQVTSGSQPLFQTDAGGAPVVRFDGVDDGMVTNVSYPLPDSNITVFAVANSSVDGKRLMSYSNAANSGRGYLTITGSNNNYGFNIGTSAGGAAAVKTGTGANTAFKIITSYRSGNTLSNQINNGTATTATNTNVPVTDLGKIWIGYGDGGGYAFLAGDIKEIIIYDHILSADEIAFINKYLSREHGIAIS